LVQFSRRVRAIADTGIDLVAVVDDAPALTELAGFDRIVSWYGANRPEFRAAVAHLPFEFHPALPPPPGVPRIAVPPVARTRILIHPFASSPSKEWPLQGFREVAAKLNAEWAMRLDRQPVHENLYHLACWLASAIVYVGNDSGITHLASAVDTPVVALFGPTDPAIWSPRGRIVEVIHRPKLEEIPVDDVLGAVERARRRAGEAGGHP
jgi:heptosyltransferase-3